MGTKTGLRRKSIATPSWVEVERDEQRQPSAVDALFTATTRRVLACLFAEPERVVHLREVLASTGAGHGAVQRELRKLQTAGLVRVEREKNRTCLQADPASPIHAELVALVRKTIGLAEPLRQAFVAAVPYIELCFAFEPERDPWAARERDLGLVFIASETIPLGVLEYGRELAEQWLGRGLWMLTPSAERLRSDPFIQKVLQRPRVWVFGSEAALEAVLVR
jgi:DNA-binding transcriptional ArsR family regulator